ncbi:MAG TPA: hypothetical protein VGN14_07370 [Candidatus Elarobacter sp.]
MSEDLVVQHAESADLLVRDGAPIEHVAFPIDALFSVAARLRDGAAFEVGTIGRRGATGTELSLGIANTPRAVCCEIEGSYAAMSRARFVQHLRALPSFRVAVQRAYAAQVFDIEQTVACNVAHGVNERAARWLLTIALHVGGERFRVRNEFLAMMLGEPNRRTAFGLEGLAEAGAIAFEGEIVSILDTATLNSAACECYGALHAYWERLGAAHNGAPF